MLKSITINNYKTFINETTFDFSASKYTFLEDENVGDGRVLKGALFMGENASGKTNILKAILFLLQTFSGVQQIDFMSMRSFYTNENNFSIKYAFSETGHIIEYLIKCGASGIEEERLITDGKTYFTRKGSTARIAKEDEGKQIKNGVSSSLSYLRKIYFDTNFSDNKILGKWAQFLQHSIYFNCLTRDLQGNPLVVDPIINHQYFEENDTTEINEFFELIKYHQKVYFSNTAKNRTISFSFPNKVLSFEKNGTDIKIPIYYESTGNQILIPVLLAVMHAIKNDCILIIDEFSSGLHNELEECLLKYFFRKSRNSQVFFTTHSTNVLDSSILRPDQIYSVKFDGNNGSLVKRFSEHNPMPRVAQNFEHMYLNGEFDGRPYYKTDF